MIRLKYMKILCINVGLYIIDVWEQLILLLIDQLDCKGDMKN